MYPKQLLACLCLFLFSVFFISCEKSQSMLVHGQALEQHTQNPIPYAKIELISLSEINGSVEMTVFAEAETDAQGKFKLSYEDNDFRTYYLRASKDGYSRPFDVKVSGEVWEEATVFLSGAVQ